MKFVSLPDDLTLDYKDNLMLAYAFINSKTLFKPECSFANKNAFTKPKDDYVFGTDAFKTYGQEYVMPSWYDFYKAHKDDESLGFLCVAGCDENDETRITLSLIPKGMEDELPVGSNGIIVSVSESLGKKKIQYIIDSIIDLFEKYKQMYI